MSRIDKVGPFGIMDEQNRAPVRAGEAAAEFIIRIQRDLRRQYIDPALRGAVERIDVLMIRDDALLVYAHRGLLSSFQKRRRDAILIQSTNCVRKPSATVGWYGSGTAARARV